MQHQQLKDGQGIREIYVDYCFVGQLKDDKAKCFVVGKDHETRMIMSSVVPAKETNHEFTARRFRVFISELRYDHVDILTKSDQKLAIVDLVRVTEESPVGSSANNEVVERGILTAEGQIRVLKDSLEERIKCVLASDHPMLALLVQFAAAPVLVNRYEVEHDGKTLYERSRSKKFKTLGLELGELLKIRRTRRKVGNA